MHLEELNWMGVESYLRRDDRILLVLGATEQHGYLSLLTDIKVPLQLADQASAKTGVVVAPPLNFGCSAGFLAYPGTISLRATTLMDAVEDMVRSVINVGFRRILVLNGHGGNVPARVRLRELANNLNLPNLHIRWYDWWTAPCVADIAARNGLTPNHANWLEAFPFTVVGQLPAEPKNTPPAAHVVDAKNVRQHYGDGSYGGPYLADPQVMRQLFDACLQDILTLLKFEH